MTDVPVYPGSGTEATTSLSLLEKARARDATAWERLVALYEPLLSRWCRQADLQEAEAADVRQEVFVAVAAHLGNFQKGAGGGTFRGWLRTITRHKIADHWRQSRPELASPGGSAAYEWLLQQPAGGEGDPLDGPDPEEVGVLYRRALELIARDFEERSWKAFWRVVVDGARPADAAAELGLTTNAVYLAKGRVLARLREEFNDLIEP